MHANFIDALGGPPVVAKLLGLKGSNVVGNWRERGVALRYRHRMAKIAKEKGVKLPPDFLEPLREFIA